MVQKGQSGHQRLLLSLHGFQCSLVILPSTHPKLKDNKFHKAHDTVVSSGR